MGLMAAACTGSLSMALQMPAANVKPRRDVVLASGCRQCVKMPGERERDIDRWSLAEQIARTLMGPG